MDYEIDVCLKEFGRISDLCADWLIKSWGLKDEDKIIAMAYYKKADKERAILARRLAGLTKMKYGKNT